MSNDCLFCPKPEKRTEWYYEDEQVIVCEKPQGGPMLVLKRHTDSPTDTERAYVSGVLNVLFGEHEVTVLMAHVEEHWHCHITQYETHPRSGGAFDEV